MKGEADLAAIGTGRPQKLCGIGGLGAELGREMEEGAFDRRRLEPHDDADPFPAAGLVDDLGQLLLVIDDEGIDIVDLSRGMDHRPRLHGMHEIDTGIVEALADEGDLGQGGRVEMADPGVVEGAEHAGMGVAFDGVEHAARE